MDDFSVSTLYESKNEWGGRLITILTPLIIDGYKSIFEESIKLCKENNELDKYLMTFQNLISRVPRWNPTIIENEKKRICEKSGCSYLEDLVTCVHIIQLKTLTAMRVGQKQKKININIPKLDDFIHKVYINAARKLYKNVYLFELNIPPLQIQKHNRELEIIIQECILNTLRESIPVESILKAYMDETIEEDVTEEIKEQEIKEQEIKENEAEITGLKNENKFLAAPPQTLLKFDDTDYMKDSNNNITTISAPKTIERLEEISNIRALQNKQTDDDNDNDNNNNNNNIRLKITENDFKLDDLDIHVIDEPKLNLLPDLLIDDIEVLD